MSTEGCSASSSARTRRKSRRSGQGSPTVNLTTRGGVRRASTRSTPIFSYAALIHRATASCDTGRITNLPPDSSAISSACSRSGQQAIHSKCPAFVVASWSDHGLHSRGTLEAFKKIASKEKWLRVHGRKKWQDFYQNVERRRQFFDRFLKGMDTEVRFWPRVSLEIRERFFVGNFRAEDEWPLDRTQYTKLFLNAADEKLSESPFERQSQIRYNVNDINDKSQRAQFDFQFGKKTELTGHMKLKLWVQADGSDDMDLFVAIEKIDRTGDIVPFQFFGNHEDGPVALGWLRVSHRELDEGQSADYQPFLKHHREIKLDPGEIVPVEIEILPSSTLFERGEKLRLVVQGSDIYAYPQEYHSDGHTETVNRGEHVIHTGGDYDAHLLVPVIPG